MSGAATQAATLPAAWFRALQTTGGKQLAAATTLLAGLLIKWAVSLHPYSGQGTPPMFGDFEAQRHWLEITTHLPRAQWYRFDLAYWGLDYPPLTALHSWLLGSIANLIEPSWVALDTSRGNESIGVKLFMRVSAIATEYAVFVPGIYWFSRVWFPSPTSWIEKNTWIFLVLLHPTLLIIDHGHFQYNSAMLGFALLAFAAFVDKRYLLGSFFFCLSLNFKQMALFYSMPVFFFLLGKCVHMRPLEGLVTLAQIGTTVIATFGVCLASVAQSWDDVVQVFVRVFPVGRGLYEDKVANFWCAANVVIKMRELFELGDLVKLSIVATLVAVVPSGLLLLWRPNKRAFMYALINGSLGFFLFSFQVHEKSILLPALPVALFVLDEPVAASWFLNVAMFSMFPLLRRDGLVLAYVGVVGLWNVLNPALVEARGVVVRAAVLMSVATMAGWHLAEAAVAAPGRYPDLYVVLNVVISAGHFGGFLAYFYLRQWSASSAPSSATSASTSTFGSAVAGAAAGGGRGVAAGGAGGGAKKVE